MKPIVLAHGYLGFAKFFGVEYFRNVSETLKAKYQVEVFAPPVAPKGTVAERAAALKTQIRAQFPRTPVHIIAHSMGGLDARYLLKETTDPLAVASLTTVCTPHYGTYAADLAVALASDPSALSRDPKAHAIFTRMLSVQAKLLADGISAALHPRGMFASSREYYVEALDTVHSIFGSLSHNDGGPLLNYFQEMLGRDNSVEELTTAFCAKNFGNCSGSTVPIYCYAASALPFQTLSPPLLLSWVVLSAVEGDNDGLVSVKSASCAPALPVLGADHAGAIGWGADCAQWYDGMIANILANLKDAA